MRQLTGIHFYSGSLSTSHEAYGVAIERRYVPYSPRVRYRTIERTRTFAVRAVQGNWISLQTEALGNARVGRPMLEAVKSLMTRLSLIHALRRKKPPEDGLCRHDAVPIV